MTPNLPIHPPNDDGAQCDFGVRDDAELIAGGWERRHLVDPSRAAESTELYESMGFEVFVRDLKPTDFGAKCQGCAETICRTYVVIYTRRTGAE